MKITDYGALSATQPDDVLPVVDVHDFTQAGTGSTKKITVANLLATTIGISVSNPAYAGGADPTGAADSTAAFQAGINAAIATGAELTVPAGTYTIASTLSVTGPLRMRGLGACLSNTNGSFLTAAVTLNGPTGSANMFSFPFQGYLWGGLEIQGFNITYTGTGNVFHQVNFTDFMFRDMQITLTGAASMAFFTSGTNSLLSGLFERVNITTTNSVRSNPMMSITSANSGAISNNTHFKCKFTNAGFDSTQFMVVYSCTTVGNGFHYADNFRECWFEHPYGGAYKSLSGMGIIVDGCSIWDAFTNSGAATTVAAASNGGTLSGIAAWANPSAGVLAVASTAGFPTTGTLTVATAGGSGTITYTGVTGGTFTGCAYTSGTGTTVATGGSVVFPTSTAGSCYYFGAAPSNTGSTGVQVTGCSRNRNGPNGSTCWDVECEATTSQVQVEGYSVKPDTASTATNAFFNFHGCNDVLLLNNVSPQGATVNGNSTTVVTSPSPTQASITQGLLSPAPLGGTGYSPADCSYLTWTYDPVLISSSNLLTSGTVYVNRVNVRQTISVTNIVTIVSTAGVTLTAGQSLLNIYNSSGTQIGITGDQSGVWTSTGIKTAALTGGPFTLTPGFYWIGLLCVWTGTAPGFARLNNPAAVGALSANAGLTGTGVLRYGTNLTAQTALPSPLVTGSNVTAGVSWWFALS